jgi:uncharacterized protein YbaR (Trm112 family)
MGEAMIREDLLAILRCPLNPGQAKLIDGGDHLRCERCALRFRIRDGFPVLVVEEAELPSGCESLDDLPCKKETRIPRRAAT